MTTRPLDLSIYPGSETFPDIVNDMILDELTYVCAICGASVPNCEPSAGPPIRCSDGPFGLQLSEIRQLKWVDRA